MKSSTQVKSVSSTKMAVATLSLLFATGLSFAALPLGTSKPTTLKQSAPKCGAKQYSVSTPCGRGQYRMARVTCQDNTQRQVGNRLGCFSSQWLSQQAQEACRNRCSGRPVVGEDARLDVRVNADTPLATNLLMGAVDQPVGKFDLSASNAEGINIRQITVSFNEVENGASVLRNIRLYDGEVQIGNAVATVEQIFNTSTYRHVTFSELNFQIPRGETKTLTIKADMAPHEAILANGLYFQPVILAQDIDAQTPGVQPSIIATGAASGLDLEMNRINFRSNDGSIVVSTIENAGRSVLTPNTGNVRANEFVAYRAKIAINWAGDAPSGVAGPNATQTVGKFIVTNQANVGNYSATVKAMNFSISTTISNSESRALRVYKDSVATTALALKRWNVGQRFGNTDMMDEDFTDVEISSGSSKTFFVTADTSDAAANNTFSITMPSSHTVAGETHYGLVWSDGMIDNIIAHNNTLPLSYKTFTY